MKPLYVVKLNGTKEIFSEEKLANSMMNCGASKKNAIYVVSKVKEKLYPFITTQKIYALACQYLSKKSYLDAATYNLKKAIRGLGPSGYHFEKFMGRIFEAKGYQVKFNKVLQGRCVRHEVDFIAKRDDHHIFAECKFHRMQGKKNDIKTALYVYARSLDLKESEKCPPFDDFYLVSNTGFSKDAIKYAHCSGLKLFGLNYPDKESVSNIVTRYRLHPISSLKKLRVRDRKELLEKDIITCKELIQNIDYLDELGLTQREQNLVLEEAKRLTAK